MSNERASKRAKTSSSVAVVDLATIQTSLPKDPNVLLDAIQDGFVAYTADRVAVAEVGHLKFDAIPGCEGDACIKSGFVRGADHFVVKVASGFYNNGTRDPPLPNSQGVMMVFSQRTGELRSVLADGGYLTDLRTAVAVAVCARGLAPVSSVKKIGIVGSGIIAKHVATQFRTLYPDISIELMVTSRSGACRGFVEEAEAGGWGKGKVTVMVTGSGAAQATLMECDIIVTATPSTEPVLLGCKKGALIVAVGADGAGKRELGPKVFDDADALLLCDSRKQCLSFGESSYVLKEKRMEEKQVVELGQWFKDHPTPLVEPLPHTTVCDLTGVAVQDVVIACMVYGAVSS